MLDKQSALIYTMVLASAADQKMTDAEIAVMSDIIKILPSFRGYDVRRLSDTARRCAELLSDPQGLDLAFGAIEKALPQAGERATAYALACDVVAADAHASQVELRLLHLLRERLGLTPEICATIEQAARVRFAPL